MTLLRVIAVLIFVCSVFVLLMGTYGLATVDWHVQLWEDVRRAGVGGPQPFDASGLRSALIQSAVGFLIVGAFSILCSVGLFLRKNWARLLWLSGLILFCALNAFSVVWKYWVGFFEFPQDIVGIALYTIVIALLFWYFSRSKTKAYFVEN